MSTAKAKVIVITSGKGGVGKTTSSAAIAAEIARRGFKTVVIDFDIGLRNLDLVTGCERRVVYDFVDVINQNANIAQAMIKDKRCENLFILPASQTRDKDALTQDGVGVVLEELKKEFDYIICDSPAGIEKGALMALYYADEAVIVTNPEVSSVRDSDRIIGVLNSKSQKAINNEEVKKHLLVTRYSEERVKKGEMLSIGDIQEILSLPLIGIIPESRAVLNSSNQGIPVTLNNKSNAKEAYQQAVSRLMGEELPFGGSQGLVKKIISSINIFNRSTTA